MPLSNASFKADRPAELVIPDCCNLGVVFRTLLGVNAAALVVNLVHSAGWRTGLLQFVEAAMVIELACLWSLFALCGLRHLLQRLQLRQHASPEAIPPWIQRMACAIVPGMVTGAVVYMFTLSEWLLSGFTYVTIGKGIFIAGLLGILYQHYFELRVRAYSPALTEARLQALQARIRPHFLFNSLNAVLSLIRSEPRRAETSLEDLADLFRVLMKDPRSMTALESEIRLCKQYLSIEKIRLGDRLQVQWRTEDAGADALRRAQIPVLLLQPLLENAVHYGIEPATGPATVQIDISRFLDRIEIVVVNPLHEKPAVASGNQMALDNIRERLALLYDVEAQLTTTMAHGFFEVRLRFPYTKGGA